MVFVSNERRLSACFPIDPDPSDCGDPFATLARVNPADVGGRIDVVRFIPKENRHNYRRLYIPHHITCANHDEWKRRLAPGDKGGRVATEYQKEIEELIAWRESRGRT